jgi:hypothetical protein
MCLLVSSKYAVTYFIDNRIQSRNEERSTPVIVKFFLYLLAGAGMLAIAFSQGLVHVTYTVPGGEFKSSNLDLSQLAGTPVGADGKLKLFDSASEFQ